MTGPTRPARARSANGRFTAAASDAEAVAAASDAATDTPEAPAVAPEEPPSAPASAAGTLELYLLRHADAGDSSLWTGDDAERPLSKKGRRQAKRLASLLRDLDLHVDAVITSPLLRAVQTAKPVAKATGVEMLTDERLGYGFGRNELAALVGQLGSMQRVVLVGHDPGFTEVVSLLAGAHVPMAKGALARIDLAERKVGAGGGTLRWLLPPDAVAR